MSKIAIVLPTRNRPQSLSRFITSVFDTCSDKNNISIYLYIDDDDRLTEPCVKELSHKYPAKIFSLIGPRIIMSDMVNKLLPYIKEDIFFFGGDDLVLKTNEWDLEIINTFNAINDKIALLYGDDLTLDNNLKSFATHPILHRAWVNCLGYLAPPYFSSDYADTWLNELADSLGRKFKLKFVNEHMHWTFGKSPLDQTYIENRKRFSKDNPPQIYNSLADVRKNDLQKLRSLINSND